MSAPSSNSIALPAPAPKKRSLLVPILLLASLVGLAAIGWWYMEQNASAERIIVSLREERARDQQHLTALLAQIEAINRNAKALRSRLNDAEGVNKTLREEILGTGMRIKLLEDNLSQLAKTQASSLSQVQLNEAEQLLSRGQESLLLSRDLDSAMLALQLADGHLAELDNPVFAGVRQTIAAEVEQLANAPRHDRAATLAALDALVRRLTALSPGKAAVATSAAAPKSAEESGWFATAGRFFSRYVRVRRVSVEEKRFQMPNRDLLNASLMVDAVLAKQSLINGDAAGFRLALLNIKNSAAANFDPAQADVRSILDELERLRALSPESDVPKIGKALAELKALRQNQALMNALNAHSAPPSAPVSPQLGTEVP